MLSFISAVYNEQLEIADLIEHVYPFVDSIYIVDDVSTDRTVSILKFYKDKYAKFNWQQMEEHTGLCEVVRIKALEAVPDDSWVLMLDADERFAPGVLEAVRAFLEDVPDNVTHVWFGQHEFIDGIKVAEFGKVKLFRKSAAHLPEVIHRDPQFDGDSANFGGIVIHRKSHEKQIMREIQYLDTYEKLFEEGKVTRGDVDWFRGMHHFVRERNDTSS